MVLGERQQGALQENGSQKWDQRLCQGHCDFSREDQGKLSREPRAAEAPGEEQSLGGD